jgi:2'-5' RNA ligase
MAEHSGTIRAFIAIKLPTEVRADVERAQRELKSATRAGSVRWTPAEQIHLTLKFLGDVQTDSLTELEAALRRACAQIAPFELHAGGIGSFPDSQRPRVIWIGVGGAVEMLHHLQAAIARETERWGEPEERTFHPHLTLGRIKTTRRRELQELGALIQSAPASNLGSWRVTQVDLMRSELFPDGARHNCLAAVPLSA